jgi:hypothetical protein
MKEKTSRLKPLQEAVEKPNKERQNKTKYKKHTPV